MTFITYFKLQQFLYARLKILCKGKMNCLNFESFKVIAMCKNWYHHPNRPSNLRYNPKDQKKEEMALVVSAAATNVNNQ